MGKTISLRYYPHAGSLNGDANQQQLTHFEHLFRVPFYGTQTILQISMVRTK